MILSIIIINYNVKYFAEQCLCSVRKAIDFFDKDQEPASSNKIEVIIIDNKSADNSISYLRPLFPWVSFVENQSNSGYAVANNQGWKMASGRYVLFLNPDTILSEESLSACISFIEKTPDAGAIGIKMFDGRGVFLPESKRGFPSPMVAFYKLSGISNLSPTSKTFARYYLGHLPDNQINEVDVLSGAFMLVKKSILATTGGFDERFFMYAEDIDLSYRIQKEGFKNYYFADSCIIHFKGESTPRNFGYTRKFYGAMIQFIKKYYGNSAHLFSWLLQAAVIIRGGLSVPAKILPSQRNASSGKDRLNTLIVGNENAAIEVRAILAKAKKPSRNILYISRDENLSKFCETHHIDEIIWVMDQTSIREITEQIKHLPSQISFYFHSMFSNSIVGSNSSLPD